MPAPLRVSEPWLFVTHGRMLPIAGKMPAAARKTPKYLAPTECDAAKMTYPMPPIAVSEATIRPRCCVRSAM